MKVAVSATAQGLDAQIDPRFGRCQYFIIVDLDTMDYETIPNESAFSSGGAGIQAAQNVARTGVEVVITGNVGPNAFRTLSTSGIGIITGVRGTVRDAVERYKRGELKDSGSPTVGDHFGMGRGAGRGMGRGSGKGIGRGGLGGGSGRRRSGD